jgi:hypothetical protein
MNEIVPRQTLVSYGTRGVFGVGGGIALLVLGGVAGIGLIPGLAVGGAVTAIGLGTASRSKQERVPGMIAAGAGILTGVASLPLVGGLAGGLLSLGGIGLLGAGGYSLYKFFKGLKARR